MAIAELEAKTLAELQDLAKELNIPNFRRFRKQELIMRVLQAQTAAQGLEIRAGILEIMPEGYGFLRTSGYLPGSEDIYVSPSQIKRFGLRVGDEVLGQVRPPKDNEKYYALLRVEAVNGLDPEQARTRPGFEHLTPVFPHERIRLETPDGDLTVRVVDLFAPIGKGQRGMIVSPPKAGKTTLLKKIGQAIVQNHPEIYLIVLLLDERPEEVTDMRRSVEAEVIASTFDKAPEEHIQVADLVLDRAKRLVEGGRDVVILLDSLTRFSRANNLVIPPSGRTLSGGLDPAALHRPKRFFGAARKIEEGGSLTIIATALVDTGSRMDDVIYEEFKGTGNMELHLNRKLQERRTFPAIDIKMSGTRREELLLSEEELRKVWVLRKSLEQLDTVAMTELILDRLRKTANNAAFLRSIVKSSEENTN
ncbi:MAG: transcription termination factor Rho [Armatimonadota bacterium]|nr:transcription termination factor Rho [Armatimonadota bacterium]MDR7485012.1 transcription termination factor Rho [Armatimonadota bacterium]MDR7533687.1 transcription termination factor Rho [Armatimonadota bacterium]MDR7535526.1 transcription termination factor Rho [Armatimonadota bacterium]